MIHSITIISHNIHILRYTDATAGGARKWLAELAHNKKITWEAAFDLARQLAQQLGLTMPTEAEELEAMKTRLVRAGYYPQIGATEDGWRFCLNTNNGKVHRPPSGRGATALAAVIAADLERRDLEVEQAKRKARSA